MKTRSLVLIGVAAFIVFAVLSAPVATLYAWFGPKAGKTQAIGLDGSLHDGRVAGILVNGRPTLSDLHWHLKPLQLLLARAAFHVEGGGDALTLDSGVALLPGGGINLSDARVAGTVKSLLGLAGQSYLPIDGHGRADAGSAEAAQGLPDAGGRLACRSTSCNGRWPRTRSISATSRHW